LVGAPATNDTVSVEVIACASNVPVIVEVPAVVDEVRVAVYCPFPAYDTLLKVPAVADNVIAATSAVMKLPFASFKVTVIVVDEEPSATNDDEPATRVDVAGEGPITVKVIDPVDCSS
jgi:hypothetical protein